MLRSFFINFFGGLLKQELKKQLKKTKNPEEVDELKNRLSYVVSGPFYGSLLLSSYCQDSLIICFLAFFCLCLPQEKWMKYEPSTNNKGRAILTEHKKKEREAAKEGKKPYYLKKCMFFVLFFVEHNSFEFYLAKIC